MPTTQQVSQTTYLLLEPIVRFFYLPYTDATGLETFTIHTPRGQLVVTKDSASVSVDDEIIRLSGPVLWQGGRWLVPVDFLTTGLSRAMELRFRHRPGTSRVFSGNTVVPELIMSAQLVDVVTRVTVQVDSRISMSLERDRESRQVTLVINPSPLDPRRETVDYADDLIRSIAFDDSGGSARIIVQTTLAVADIRLTALEGGRTFFVDFSRAVATESANVTPPDRVAVPDRPRAEPPEPPQSPPGLRVVVIDPGHGGLDAGAQGGGVQEKDLNLEVARRIRTTLRSRLDVTTILTRDSDIALTNEERAAIANGNQANLFISIHSGYSHDPNAAGSYVFLMKEDFGREVDVAAAEDRLFVPWYLAYQTNWQPSRRFAGLVQELARDVPGWQFALRTAPLGTLTSMTMPALLLELGNLNNPRSVQIMRDARFQDRLVLAIVTAIERFQRLGAS